VYIYIYIYVYIFIYIYVYIYIHIHPYAKVTEWHKLPAQVDFSGKIFFCQK